MNLTTLRFVLAVGALFAVALLAALILFCGKGLSEIQIGLLTLLASALISETKASSAYIFDGTPDEADPAAPAASTASPPSKGTSP